MVLRVISSSSKGNCYLLTANNGETLIIEAGVPMKEIKKALNWDFSQVVGCIITHQHKDHCRSLKDMILQGVRTLALSDVFKSQGIKTTAFVKEVTPNRGYKIGLFRLFVLNVVHDVPCVCFIIEHPEMGKLLFLTDTMMIEYKLPKLDHIMIEANYSDEILRENISTGVVPASMRKRLLNSHMELGTTLETLKASDLSTLKEVILLHLSSQNSDADEFRRKCQEVTGIPCYIAKPFLELTLAKDPY